MQKHRAQEDAFGGDANVSLVADAPPLERCLPLLLVGKDRVDLCLPRKPCEDRVRQLLGRHVLQRHAAKDIVEMAAAQELEKVDPALALGALEPREPLVADVRAVAVLARSEE